MEFLLVVIKGLLLHATKPMVDAVLESMEARMSTFGLFTNVVHEVEGSYLFIGQQKLFSAAFWTVLIILTKFYLAIF